MKISTLALAAAAALSLAACATTSPAQTGGSPSMNEAGAGDLAAYPAATAGQTRTVIRLPAEQNEDDFKVELIVGRTLTVDCNVQRLGGAIQTKTAEGWGYDYYVVSDLGQAASTMMACPPGSEHQAFVRGGGEPMLIRYNSRLPVVVYAPQNVEVRYRLWRAGAEVPASR